MVKMLVVVVIFYSACWLPFNFFWVFNLDWDKRINPYIFSVCHILVQFHSCVNPVIYVWMNSKVRWGCLHAIGMKFYPSLISLKFSQPEISNFATIKSNLQYYIFVAVFGQVKAVCLEGFSDHWIFVCPYFYYYLVVGEIGESNQVQSLD